MRRTIVVAVAVVLSGAAAWFVWRTSSGASPADERGSTLPSGTAVAPSAIPAGSPSATLAGRPAGLAAPIASRGGKPDDRADANPNRAPIAGLLAELSSQDVDVRRAAAERIVDAGYFAIERVARWAAPLDSECWQTFADAVSKKTWFPSADGALVAAAHAAPEAHRRRLLDLARRMNPEAGKTPTPAEIEALVKREVVEKAGTQDDWPGGVFVLFGHAGVPAILGLFQEGGTDTEILDRARSVLSTIAQPEDIPVLKRLLLEGKSSVAEALGRLDALGFTEALDALVAAVRSEEFDRPVARDRITTALCQTSERERAARAVREWIAAHDSSLTDDERFKLANLFAVLESRADVPTLEAWSASSRDPKMIVGLALMLTELGSAKGIEILVRVVEGKKVESSPQPGQEDAGRLGAEGFDEWQHLAAIKSLDAVALQASSAEDGSSGARPKEGPWSGVTAADLDRIAAEVRAWWKASRDRLQFDEKAGEWRLKSN